MTYSANGLIDPASFNDLASTPGIGVICNSFYNTGSGPYGYGQADPFATVVSGQSVTSAMWTSLNSRIALMGNHKGVTLAAAPSTGVGDLVRYSANIYNNLVTLNQYQYWAAAQGTPTSTTTTCTNTWKQQCAFTHTITFPTGDSARYFFNAGGQIKLTYSSPTGPSYKVDYLISNLASGTGTVVLSAPSMGEFMPNGTKIAGTMFNGITQLGNAFAPVSINPRLGYYGLYGTSFTDTASLALTQKAAIGINTYLNTTLKVQIYSNRTQGSNQDNGNIIYIRSIFDEVPDGGVGDTTVSVGTAATCSIVPPSTTYLAKSWGTPTVVGSFTAT